MKTWISWTVGSGLAVALFAIAGLAQDDSAPASDAAPGQSVSAMADPNTTDNPPSPAAATQNLENAPGKIISTPTAAESAPASVQATGPIADMVKLVQAGVSQDVLMAYVTNSAVPYNLSSDDIVYLKDIGTPDVVVTTMIQRDQLLRNNPGAAATVQQQPLPPAQPTQPVENMAPNNEPQTAPLTPNASAEYAAAPNGSYTYFYDSLAPYGNWIDIAGYGPCWQPTVVVSSPSWQPYCDSGHWVYTDSGWCWMSDYSWGWAPFHYGRWFRHHRWGWCWAPDTIWGPSWVSWRYNDGYCGWAPLPPTACYRPGFGFTYYGRSVDFAFGFGLSADWYVFVPLGHCYDRDAYRYRVPRHEVTKIYNNTTIINQYVKGDHNRIVNKGVPVERVASASHMDIKPVRIREHNEGPGPARFERSGKELAVYHPSLPEPKPSRATALVGEGVKPNPHFNAENRNRRIPLGENNTRSQQPGTGGMTTDRTGRHSQQPAVTAPNVPTQPRPDNSVRRDNNPSRDNNARENRTTVEPGEKPGSLIYRGPNHQKPAGNDVISQPTAPNTPQREERTRPDRSVDRTPSTPTAPIQRQAPANTPNQPIQSAPLTPEHGLRQNRGDQRQNDVVQPRGNSPQFNPHPQQPVTPSYQTPRQTEQRQPTEPSFPQNRNEREMQQPRSAPFQPAQPAAPSYQTPREQPRWNNQSAAPAVSPRVYESRPSAPVQSAPGYSRGESRRNYDNGNGNGNGRDNRGNRGND